jgi:hypothetical protein
MGGTGRARLSRREREELGVVEFPLVGEDVRVRVRRDGEVALSTNSPIRAQGTPRRCKSEMRRCRRSWGDQSGTPSARQAFAIAVRSASAPLSGKSRAVGSRSSRAPSDATTASASAGGSSIQSARRFFVVCLRSRTRRRVSS